MIGDSEALSMTAPNSSDLHVSNALGNRQSSQAMIAFEHAPRRAGVE